MASMTDGALQTAEQIVLDGANGVTSAPRQHFPDAGLSAGIAAVALVIALLTLRRRRGTALILGALLVAAVPGAVHVLVMRADAPLKRGGLTTTVTGTLTELQARAPWPGAGVQVVREDDDVLFPLTRYAVPTRASSAGVMLEVRGSALAAQCREEAGRQICGAGP